MPTDTYKTLSELNILFQKMIMHQLGLLTGSPIDYESAAYFVRVAWPTDGAPAWKVTENITFIRTVEEDDPVNRQREVVHTRVDDLTLNEETKYTRVISLNIIFYGPNSWENAQTVRDGIFNDHYRLPLAKDKLYPIPDIISPNRVPEAFQNRWWERVDLEVRFNEAIVKNQNIGTIESVEVLVSNETGVVFDETITTD